MLGERSSAEDAAQDAFIKAYRSLEGFKGGASFSTWLYRIAANRCLDLLRRRAREKSESLEVLLERESAALRDLLPQSPDAALAVERADLAERVLGHLPPDYRLILTLREVQGLSYRELSSALGCSLDAVKARLKRARKTLEGALRHFLEPGNV
jgi:RNA polymerase sigma-70 factor (ECF subfamily)